VEKHFTKWAALNSISFANEADSVCSEILLAALGDDSKHLTIRKSRGGMPLRVALFVVLSVVSAFAQNAEEAAILKRMLAIKDRLEVQRKDYGEEGTIFKVRISPPKQASYNSTRFDDLSEAARAVDIPCKKVEIGLNSYGPNGRKDLSLMLGFHRVPGNDDLLLEFHLPKSHSGHENGLPFLVLFCSGIHKEDGSLVDWMFEPIPLMSPADLKKDATSKMPRATPVTQNAGKP
jgi:hypothetical protein